MFVTVVALMCHFLTADVPVCQEEIVTTSDLTEGLTLQGCLAGAQAPLAKWKEENPIYKSQAWRVQGYKCVPGHYEIRGRA